MSTPILAANVPYERAKNINVPHGFFGKNGGCSQGFFSSLNCSQYVGDPIENVRKNLQTVANCLHDRKGSELNAITPRIVTLKQVHSNVCLEVSKTTLTKLDDADSNPLEADALITRAPGIAIGILTADCAPILFYDPVHSVIGAAHAGWRGAASGIIESTVRCMNKLKCKTSDILAAIGPCICLDSYEVNEDFAQNFPGSGDCFCSVSRRLHFDLPKFCRKKLLSAGIKETNIEALNIDTYSQYNSYFSYRFANNNSNGVCGRQLSAIGLW